MSVKLSGLSSNLDTESMIKALVSAYSVSKDNLQKAQTKLSWTKDAWKSMNTKIYSFYSKSISNMKLSASYNKKTSAVSDATIAKVTSSASATSGTQSLEVIKLAASGYLTGGNVSTETTVDGVTKSGKATLTSKLSDIKGLSAFTSGTISAGIGTNTTDIDLTADMTVGKFVTQLKEAGVNASFDEVNQRFFVSAKSSGVDNDFTLTASDSKGLTALQSMGLYTANATDSAEYSKWINYTPADIATIKTNAYTSAKTNYDSVAAEYKGKYDSASNNVTTLTSTNGQLTTERASLNSKLSDVTLSVSDKASISTQIASIDDKVTANQTSITSNQTAMSDNEPYVILATDDDTTKATKTTNIQNQVDSRNAIIKTNIDKTIDDKVVTATQALAITSGSAGAVRTVGEDAKIILNGATFTNSTNNFQVNGLTIQALNYTKADTPVSVTTDTDVDGIYKMIKDFFKGYDELINGMDSAVNADSAGSYEPLTADEKSAMTDTQVGEWEKKIKDSLLRKDSTLDGVIGSMKTEMLGSYKVDGKSYSLASFGINTLSYFTAADNERGAYHIDGDADDTSTSGNADKLRAAIASDPDAITSFFTQLTSSVYTDLTKRMKSSSLRSAYTIYNDKQIDSEYSEYTTKIADQNVKISNMEDYYNKKFTAMETALSKLNSNSSSLSSLLGS